jgi:hypothetical protein
MYCQKCGTSNDDNFYKCKRCGTILHRDEGLPRPHTLSREIPTHLPQAILATIFCCLPFGIPAIVFASQVNGRVAAGDIPGAIDASKKAQMWCWVSFGLSIGAWLLYLLAIIVLSVSQSQSGS